MKKQILDREKTLEAIKATKSMSEREFQEEIASKSDIYLEEVCEYLEINPIYKEVVEKFER